MEDRSDKNYLTPAEKLVMRVIWLTDHQLVLHEVQDACNTAYKKSWKSQTVSTYLSHLVQKGFLRMRKKGKYCYYRPAISYETFMKYDTANFASYWQVDPEQLLEFLMQAKKEAE